MLVFMGVFLLILSILWMGELYSRRKEREYGYPKNIETDQDVEFLILQNEEILAMRCYMRIHRVSLKIARDKVSEIKKQLVN
ncbi:hypothetical protein [Neisseria sp. 83E34]|uniref:hypothetical protein n=1 Tax=Neisseria sp. 83E34 TaxID=1692264 RepID=UPI0006CE7645|nr:hypothetical protein [Neisseria sp. 83E34]KPN72180.1 hypothetical protein AKG09_03195 [Neisseria sp. 83E34]